MDSLQLAMVRHLRIRNMLAASLTLLLAACGGGGVSVPANSPQAAASGVTALPATAAFATAKTLSPTTSAGPVELTLPFAAASGFSGSATLHVPAVTPSLHIIVTYSSSSPPQESPFARAKKNATRARSSQAISASLGASSDADDRVVAYASIGANQTVILSGPPHYEFVLPVGFAPNGVSYYLALWQNGAWVGGYSASSEAIASASSTTVAVDGRFALTIPANGKVSVVLYARNISAATPSPAQAPSPTPLPVGTPTPPTAMPTPTATPYYGPTASSSSLTFASNVAQPITVSQIGYGGTFVQSNTCAGIATVTPANASGPAATFTVTPLAAGACTITFSDAAGLTAVVSVGITTVSIPVF